MLFIQIIVKHFHNRGVRVHHSVCVCGAMWTSFGSGQGNSVHWGPYLQNHSQEYRCKWSIKLNVLYILYWYFEQNQCLNKKKNILHTTYSVHRLARGPYDRIAPGQLPMR